MDPCGLISERVIEEHLQAKIDKKTDMQTSKYGNVWDNKTCS
jgi:hypothetical protein